MPNFRGKGNELKEIARRRFRFDPGKVDWKQRIFRGEEKQNRIIHREARQESREGQEEEKQSQQPHARQNKSQPHQNGQNRNDIDLNDESWIAKISNNYDSKYLTDGSLLIEKDKTQRPYPNDHLESTLRCPPILTPPNENSQQFPKFYPFHPLDPTSGFPRLDKLTKIPDLDPGFRPPPTTAVQTHYQTRKTSFNSQNQSTKPASRHSLQMKPKAKNHSQNQNIHTNNHNSYNSKNQHHQQNQQNQQNQHSQKHQQNQHNEQNQHHSHHQENQQNQQNQHNQQNQQNLNNFSIPDNPNVNFYGGGKKVDQNSIENSKTLLSNPLIKGQNLNSNSHHYHHLQLRSPIIFYPNRKKRPNKYMSSKSSQEEYPERLKTEPIYDTRNDTNFDDSVSEILAITPKSKEKSPKQKQIFQLYPEHPLPSRTLQYLDHLEQGTDTGKFGGSPNTPGNILTIPSILAHLAEPREKKNEPLDEIVITGVQDVITTWRLNNSALEKDVLKDISANLPEHTRQILILKPPHQNKQKGRNLAQKPRTDRIKSGQIRKNFALPNAQELSENNIKSEEYTIKSEEYTPHLPETFYSDKLNLANAQRKHLEINDELAIRIDNIDSKLTRYIQTNRLQDTYKRFNLSFEQLKKHLN